MCKCRKEFGWEPLQNTLHARHVYLRYCRFRWTRASLLIDFRFHVAVHRTKWKIIINHYFGFTTTIQVHSTQNQPIEMGESFRNVIEKREQMLLNEICWKTRVNLWNLHPNILVSFSFQTQAAMWQPAGGFWDFYIYKFIWRSTVVVHRQTNFTVVIWPTKAKKLEEKTYYKNYFIKRQEVCAHRHPNNEFTNNNNKFNLIRNAKSKMRKQQKRADFEKNLIREQ